MGTVLLAGLFLIVVALAGYTAVHNKRISQERTQKARERGWRYTPLNWTQLIKPEFKLAGRTHSGAIWELQRFWRDGKLLLNWQTHSASLPYGVVGILPVQTSALPATSPFKTYTVSASIPAWPETYQLFTSHNRLAHLFFTEPISRLLQQYPVWPEKGSLEQLIWVQKSLSIVCLYEDDWDVLERIVALGSTLVETLNK